MWLKWKKNPQIGEEKEKDGGKESTKVDFKQKKKRKKEILNVKIKNTTSKHQKYN